MSLFIDIKKGLSSFNLDVSMKSKGGIIGFLGASGSGKSMTLKCIAGLEKADKGKIIINDKVLFDSENKINIKTKDRKVGFLFQNYALFPHMTIRENIELIPKLQKVDSEKIIENTKKLMQMVGLNCEEFLDRYPTELSGGQQQRVGVARAFANDPDIILMDEPFSALDPMTRSDLQDELVELQSKLKKTIVFVTHDMDEAIKISDMICIMKDGEVLQYDTPENILRNPVDEFVSNFVGKNRIWSSPEYIKISDIMIDKPITSYKNLSVFKCIDKMRQKKVDSLLIIEPNDHKLIGIVKASKLRGIEDKTQPVEKFMNKNFSTLLIDECILDALKVVTEEHISTVPVVDDDSHLVGLVTRSSLVTTLSQQYFDYEEDEII